MRNGILTVAAAILVTGCAAGPQSEADHRGGMADSFGNVMGHEEHIGGRTRLFDPNGNPVGERWVDLRNEGTNPGNKGISVVVEPVASPK